LREALYAKNNWAAVFTEERDKFYDLKEELADQISAQRGYFQEFLEGSKDTSAKMRQYKSDNSGKIRMLNKENANMLQNSIDKLETKIAQMHTQLVEKLKRFDERMREALEKLPEVERNCDNAAVRFEHAVKDLIAFNDAYKKSRKGQQVYVILKKKYDVVQQ
uniref:DUF148 domain-containing protein n=1 Tax=Gongylonema pulchrum TaxID=637853 RepID=A0A183DKK2_9BILA